MEIKQHGFLMIGAVVLVAVLGLALTLLWNRLDACHKETAKVEAAYTILAQYVEEQNSKIATWERDAIRATAPKGSHSRSGARPATILSRLPAPVYSRPYPKGCAGGTIYFPNHQPIPSTMSV